MRISLITICRDEAENLDRCLESVRGVADELCVLDTGSTDDTIAVARRHGATVGELPWGDDFAAARNASLGLATGDWALILDADEELVTPGARAALEGFALAHPRAIGRLRLANLDAEGAGSEIDLSRFFPLGMGLTFRGKVHEQLAADARELERLDTGAKILHHGYRAETIAARSKLQRNRRLLTLAVEEDPADPYLWYHLGRTAFVAEEHQRALDACARAIELLGAGDTPYLGLLYETAGYALRSLGRSAEARTLLGRVERRFHRRADTRFLIALLELDAGRLAEAEAGFLACLELEGVTPEGGETTRSCSTWAPAFNLGVMHEVLQHLDVARDWYRRALEHHPDHPASLEALARCGAAR